jgi:hypothetical protein
MNQPVSMPMRLLAPLVLVAAAFLAPLVPAVLWVPLALLAPAGLALPVPRVLLVPLVPPVPLALPVPLARVGLALLALPVPLALLVPQVLLVPADLVAPECRRRNTMRTSAVSEDRAQARAIAPRLLANDCGSLRRSTVLTEQDLGEA